MTRGVPLRRIDGRVVGVLPLPAPRAPIGPGRFSSCHGGSLNRDRLSPGATVALAILFCWLSIALPVGASVYVFARAGGVAPLTACAKGGDPAAMCSPIAGRIAVALPLRGTR